MKLVLLAVGKLAHGPETTLCDAYLQRAAATGRQIGGVSVEAQVVDARRRGVEGEADALLDVVSHDAALIACDERGEALSSRALADLLARHRDSGLRRLIFAIGGADGLSDRVRGRAERLLAFGPQTWPHALARVMLHEQVYRALSILAGSPYHRD